MLHHLHNIAACVSSENFWKGNQPDREDPGLVSSGLIIITSSCWDRVGIPATGLDLTGRNVQTHRWPLLASKLLRFLLSVDDDSKIIPVSPRIEHFFFERLGIVITSALP